MSHIQKILERAERDGSIRPSAVPLVDPPRSAVAAPSEAVFPVRPVEAPVMPGTPAVAPAPPSRVAAARLDPALLRALDPGSASAEQFRSIRTRLQQAAHGRSFHALAITSPAAGEGRTHTAGSLALSMTQEFDRRVCLVDAHLRRPDVRTRFGLPPGPGLIDVLTDDARLEDALVHIDEYNLTILPGGDATTATELLGSTAMRRVLQALRASFDRIVIDAPPAVPVTDVSLLTPLVDAVLLVVRAGVTPRPTIHDAITGINSDKLVGVVLNDAQ